MSTQSKKYVLRRTAAELLLALTMILPVAHASGSAEGYSAGCQMCCGCVTGLSTMGYLYGGSTFQLAPPAFMRLWKPGVNFGFGMGTPVIRLVEIWFDAGAEYYAPDLAATLRELELENRSIEMSGGGIWYMHGLAMLKANIWRRAWKVFPYVLGGCGYTGFIILDMTLRQGNWEKTYEGGINRGPTILGGAGAEYAFSGRTRTFLEGTYRVSYFGGETDRVIPIKLGVRISL